MLKLYKKNDKTIEYWETWDKDKKTGIVHWGLVGETGQNKEIVSKLFSDFHKAIQLEINEMIQQGFKPIEDEDFYRIMIEFKIEGHGEDADLEKRHKLEERMSEFLGWRGLGHCDGGSIGSGTMEVCCFVVDFEIAKRAIEADLLGTEFQDYKRIFNEDD